MAILILGDETDEHARHVRDTLLTRGADAEFLDSTRFPVDLQVGFEPVTGAGGILLPSSRRIEFNQVRAIYWRTYAGTAHVQLPNSEQAMIARHDARSLFESLFTVLPCRWVNGQRAFQLHQSKPAALAIAAKLGAHVPATLVGNDPRAVVDFASRHERCIFKPVQGGAFTERLSRDHLTEENLKSLTAAPVTIQQEVEGVDTRVFVAGERVMACEVRTDALDFREDGNPTIVAVELPPDIQDMCRRIARALDLLWTGIDLRRTPQGEYFYFEANPSPMFLGFERRCGLPLTEALTELLLEA